MFTVVISEQEHLDSIVEYKAFLKPFLDKGDIALCRWNPEGETLTDMVPELNATVSRHQKWRLVVICDEEGLKYRNPFDVVRHRDPERPEGMEDAQYYELRREARNESYNRAAGKPLTKLMTWLCRAPIVSESANYLEEEDPEFREYLAQHWAKAEIRKRILGDYIPEISLPSQIYCVAKRCFDGEQAHIDNSWRLHVDSSYSRFYDFNMYFDKMRYLVFDILPHNNRNYTVDYIRFLYAVMLLAEHEVPMGSLNPNRVYVINCVNDEKALTEHLQSYDNKLTATIEAIQIKRNKIQNEVKPRLSDRDAQVIFCSDMPVPVSTVKEFDQSTLYVSRKDIGLSTDCPVGELGSWEKGYQNSRRALGRFLKAPRRALRKTTSELHRINKANLEDAGRLNEFQVEDIAEHVAEEELKMISIRTCDLYDTERYTKQMEAQNKRINTIIEKRMTKKWTITLGCVALGCYLVGFLPMFFSNIKATNGTLFSLIFFAAGGALMALIAFLILFFLRQPLRAAYSDYNGIMKGVINDVESSVMQYSKYLSHACNVMRGNSVLNFCNETEDPNAAKIRVLKKHEMDVMCVREEFRDIFGMFLNGKNAEVDPADGFTYDFLRPVEYTYPIPFDGVTSRRIEFLQKGNYVDVPVDFVKSMSIRREELYD